jgi:hypothetical protein
LEELPHDVVQERGRRRLLQWQHHGRRSAVTKDPILRWFLLLWIDRLAGFCC